ncbi:hypothetical protein QGM71_13690 [Virgibacillus sp. C22-A2]|uniref:ABC-2 family transporter protein n=1 Tax=Virgibacillus tibetensis TaxID=3042313 RepID=A0ABU6KHJ3_9BACI|nr:hypothetical protein [Virgibacillus sp. C22-A2]
MNYLKLVNFELGRFIKIYFVLIGITVVSQITGVIVIANRYLKEANIAIYEDLMPQAQFLEMYGPMSFSNITRTSWFMGPIALSIAALIFYIFLIWYRDWFGKNTFIYRLLMLPTARINIYLAKATSIFLMVLGLVSIQLILLPIESTLLKWIVPKNFRLDMSIDGMIESSKFLFILFPPTFIEFLLHYGIGFMAVFLLFTAVLFERSFRIKGVFAAILYSTFSIALFILPLLLEGIYEVGYFYPVELLLLEIILGLFVIGLAVWVSHYLLNKKITV